MTTYQSRTHQVDAIEFTEALAADLFARAQAYQPTPGFLVNAQGGYSADLVAGPHRLTFGDFVIMAAEAKPERVMDAASFVAAYETIQAPVELPAPERVMDAATPIES